MSSRASEGDEMSEHVSRVERIQRFMARGYTLDAACVVTGGNPLDKVEARPSSYSGDAVTDLADALQASRAKGKWHWPDSEAEGSSVTARRPARARSSQSAKAGDFVRDAYDHRAGDAVAEPEQPAEPQEDTEWMAPPRRVFTSGPEAGQPVTQDDRCGTCHRDAHRPGMPTADHGHAYAARGVAPRIWADLEAEYIRNNQMVGGSSQHNPGSILGRGGPAAPAPEPEAGN
jgi:hypothetical protein